MPATNLCFKLSGDAACHGLADDFKFGCLAGLLLKQSMNKQTFEIGSHLKAEVFVRLAVKVRRGVPKAPPPLWLLLWYRKAEKLFVGAHRYFAFN